MNHINGVDGVRVHEEKIREIKDWLEPRNVTELRGFVSICTSLEVFQRVLLISSTTYRFEKEGSFQLDTYSAKRF